MEGHFAPPCLLAELAYLLVVSGLLYMEHMEVGEVGCTSTYVFPPEPPLLSPPALPRGNIDPSVHASDGVGVGGPGLSSAKKGLEARRMSRRGPGASCPGASQPGFGSKDSGYLFLFTRFPV